MIDQAGPR